MTETEHGGKVVISTPLALAAIGSYSQAIRATAAGIGTVMRDAGTLVMFAGTPYAHLHICGSPWDGNEYRPGDRAIRTLTYGRP